MWSPDSREVAFFQRSGSLVIRPADGAGEPVELPFQNQSGSLSDWSLDGRFLIYDWRDSVTASVDLWFLERTGTGNRDWQSKPFFVEKNLIRDPVGYLPTGAISPTCPTNQGKPRCTSNLFRGAAGERPSRRRAEPALCGVGTARNCFTFR